MTFRVNKFHHTLGFVYAYQLFVHTRKSNYCCLILRENHTLAVCCEKSIKKWNNFGCNKTFPHRVNKTYLHYSLAKVNKVIA